MGGGGTLDFHFHATAVKVLIMTFSKFSRQQTNYTFAYFFQRTPVGLDISFNGLLSDLGIALDKMLFSTKKY